RSSKTGRSAKENRAEAAMSSAGNGQSKRYSVPSSKQTNLMLEQLYQQAIEAGTSQKFMAALRHIGERLQQDPLHFGEPLYRLPALMLSFCQAVFFSFVVIF